VPELVERAGGVNLFGQAGRHAPGMSWEQMRAADPDAIVLMPCGFDLARTCQDVPILAAKEGWSELRAVRGGRVFATDGNQYFNRPGPRLVESLEVLAEVLHPEAFAFGHEGTAWQRI
jgi:iron complex transport system substrate-binding protein